MVTYGVWFCLVCVMKCSMSASISTENTTDIETEKTDFFSKFFNNNDSKQFSSRQLIGNNMFPRPIPPPPPPPPPPLQTFHQSHIPSVLGTPEDDDLVYHHYPVTSHSTLYQQYYGSPLAGRPIGRPSFRPFDPVDLKPFSNGLSPFTHIDNGLGNPHTVQSLNGIHHLSGVEFRRPEQSIATPTQLFSHYQTHGLGGINTINTFNGLGQFGTPASTQYPNSFQHLDHNGMLVQEQILSSLTPHGRIPGQPLTNLHEPLQPMHWQTLEFKKNPSPSPVSASFTGYTPDGHKVIDTSNPNFLAWALNRTKFGAKPVVVMVTGNKFPTSILTDKPNLHSFFRSPEETMLHVDLDKSTISSLSAEAVQNLLQNLKKKPKKPTLPQKPSAIYSPLPVLQPPFFDPTLGGRYEGPVEDPWDDIFGGPFDLFDFMPNDPPEPSGLKQLFQDWKLFTVKPNPGAESIQSGVVLKEPVTLSKPGDRKKPVNSVPALESKWLRFLLERIFKPYKSTQQLVIAPSGLAPNAYMQHRTAQLERQNGTLLTNGVNNEIITFDNGNITNNGSDTKLPETMLDFNLRAIISPR